jgi:hypothetical protein
MKKDWLNKNLKAVKKIRYVCYNGTKKKCQLLHNVKEIQKQHP